MTLTGEARTTARTGVEMEAMTACAVGALTVYDMVKGLERGVEWARSRWSRRPAARRTGAREDAARPMKAAVLTISTSVARGRGRGRLGARTGRAL